MYTVYLFVVSSILGSGSWIHILRFSETSGSDHIRINFKGLIGNIIEHGLKNDNSLLLWIK